MKANTKSTSMHIRVNPQVKEKAGVVLNDIGLSFSDVFNLLLNQIANQNRIPFELKSKLPLELNDGHGSYICEHGHLHDYSKFSPSLEEEQHSFKSWKDAKEWLDA